MARVLTAEEELAQRVQEQVLPTLRQQLTALSELQSVWLVNGIEDKIEAAAANNETIAGYSAADWFAWGEALRQLQTMIATPIAALGGATLAQVLIKRYVPTTTGPTI